MVCAMKKVFGLFLLVLVVAACNLSSKLRNSNSSNSGSSTGSGSTGGEEVEKPNPTAAQQATIANGQTVTWDQQGITITMPSHWKKGEVRNEMFIASGQGAHLSINISPLPQMASLTDTSIKAMHEAAKTQQKIGKYDEVKWLELDGLRGVEFRESKQEMAGDIRRLQWQAYRTYGGYTQLVNMILSSDSGNFPKHEDELYAILYSTRIVH
jgi:hypothetical protein